MGNRQYGIDNDRLKEYATEIKKVVENWSATTHLGLDFSFDNLPDANEISEKLNIQKLIHLLH